MPPAGTFFPRMYGGDAGSRARTVFRRCLKRVLRNGVAWLRGVVMKEVGRRSNSIFFVWVLFGVFLCCFFFIIIIYFLSGATVLSYCSFMRA